MKKTSLQLQNDRNHEYITYKKKHRLCEHINNEVIKQKNNTVC